MKFVVTFLIMPGALSLAACGKSETVSAEVETTPARLHPVSFVTPEAGLAVPQASAANEASPVAVQSDLAHGQQIYRQTCAFCHDKGITGAPIIGEASDWRPRLAQGMTALYASALQGRNAMPAKGGNPSLADADVRAAVDYLAGQAH